jgi:excisionase family DNA binding protein
MKSALTPKELADAIGVSESSLRRWVDAGAIQTFRTVGGHRRIPMADALRFVRQSGSTVVRPELLGLSAMTGHPDLAEAQATDQLYESLSHGDAAGARQIIMSLYLANHSPAAIADGPVRSAMHRLGELWRHDQRGILIEHRGVDVAIGAITQLRQVLPPVPGDAPLALGGAVQGDPYLPPSILAALVLVDAGWREMNYGPNTPVGLLARAAEQHEGRLVWLTLSVPPDRAMRAQALQLAKHLQARATTLVVGGRHAADLQLPQRPNIQILDSMSELHAFARGLRSSNPTRS